MADDFKYDVFLSHSAKDKDIVRPIAERLRSDGLRVWFDEWEFKASDSKTMKVAKIEEGLGHSRTLMLCISASAFGAGWAQLEAGTFRFRDPLNTDRRFIPLRLDLTPLPHSLAQFSYSSWLPEAGEQEYAKLLESCQPPVKQSGTTETEAAREQIAAGVIHLNPKATIEAYAFSPEGKRALLGATNHTIQVWDVAAARCLDLFEGHTSPVHEVAWSADQR